MAKTMGARAGALAARPWPWGGSQGPWWHGQGRGVTSKCLEAWPRPWERC